MWSAGYCWFFYGLKDGGILAGIEVDVLEGVDVASSVSVVLVTVTVLETVEVALPVVMAEGLDVK